MRAMICMPMAGKTDQEIRDTYRNTKEHLECLGYEVENTLFDMDNDWLVARGYRHIPLVYLAESLRAMSRCDAVYYCEGWGNNRGCVIENAAAVAYGLATVCVPERMKEDGKDV